MGGAVFLGIRRSDGTEHLYETWTNSIPCWFVDPEFINDGASVDEFVAIAEETIASGNALFTKRHKSVTYSEYGVILIDHVAKKILSCQGYTRPGRLLARWHDGTDTHLPADTAAMILKLNDAGRLNKITRDTLGGGEELPEAEVAALLRLCRETTDGHFPTGTDIRADVYVDLSDFEYTHRPDCGKEERRLVREFLDDNGWQARVRGTKSS